MIRYFIWEYGKLMDDDIILSKCIVGELLCLGIKRSTSRGDSVMSDEISETKILKLMDAFGIG